jgi:hypothetical protein
MAAGQATHEVPQLGVGRRGIGRGWGAQPDAAQYAGLDASPPQPRDGLVDGHPGDPGAGPVEPADGPHRPLCAGYLRPSRTLPAVRGRGPGRRAKTFLKL